MHKLSGFTSHIAGMGETLSYTYGEIQDNKIVNSNIRESIIVCAENSEEEAKVLEAIYIIRDYLNKKLPTE